MASELRVNTLKDAMVIIVLLQKQQQVVVQKHGSQFRWIKLLLTVY